MCSKSERISEPLQGKMGSLWALHAYHSKLHAGILSVVPTDPAEEYLRINLIDWASHMIRRLRIGCISLQFCKVALVVEIFAQSVRSWECCCYRKAFFRCLWFHHLKEMVCKTLCQYFKYMQQILSSSGVYITITITVVLFCDLLNVLQCNIQKW